MIETDQFANRPAVSEMPAALSKGVVGWFSVFGPGAIIASLTIGTGELIFSSRGGSLFGYRILFFFAAILLCKWLLVLSTARHMVVGGVHPLRRWMDLPGGPRGWFPMVLFLFAALCIPIWVSFHSSVLGDLLAGLVGTKQWFSGITIHLWGMVVLVAILALAWSGGYSVLERVQLIIVVMMLGSMMVALLLMKPDWLQLAFGLFVPQPLEFPNWLDHEEPVFRGIASKPVWAELTLYVGVIGGASYDYLAYCSYLRDKCWGLARDYYSPQSTVEPQTDIDADTARALQSWVWVPLVDCSLSFLVVLVFSGAFVVSGHLILAPQQQIPGDGNFLEYQAQFVTQLHPWLYPLYVLAVSLTMLGTLYGTLEVAPAMLREFLWAMDWKCDSRRARRLRQAALGWCGGGALIVLAICLGYQYAYGAGRPPAFTDMLVPANLFTGVFSCGLICLLAPWTDWQLPLALRSPKWLNAACLLVGALFLTLGVKGYWEYARWPAIGMLFGTIATGWIIAWLLKLFKGLS